MASLTTILANLGPIIQGNNILLFIVLILLFVVGYKLLQTVIRLGLIAVMSGVFLVVLNMVGVGPTITVQRVILFMVLGTGLFIFYSTLATALSIFDWVYAFLKRILRWAFSSKKPRNRKKRLKKIGGKLRNAAAKTKNREGSSHHKGSKEKEIVLGELKDD